uniref:Putative methyltransferase n=1 Tax=viral metagenome TaxID=1070528 RepID=A0A6M3K160_9ZZZZ
MTIETGKVAMVSINDIDIGKRAREVFGDLEELESSLKDIGLISPLAVKETNNNEGEEYKKPYFLLAGERRFKVLEKNKVLEIPVRIYPHNITDIEIRSIELSENFYRKDFEYWEHDNLVREIDSLQKQIYGVKAPGPGQVGWSMEDTGKMIGASKGSVSTAVKRAEAREAFPELFENIKTQSDASKLMKKMDEAVVKEVLAKKIELSKESGSVRQLANNFILKDFFVGVKEIPDGIMHLVEIDPPYAIRLQEAKKSDGESAYNREDYNEIDSSHYQVFMAEVFRECYRTMTENSWLLCWFGPEPWFEMLFQEILNAGFESTRMCGIWTKPSGQSKRPEMHLANSYEMFFYAWKGRPALNKAGRRNVFDFAPVPPQQKTHPTERPVDLIQEIYDTFAFPGSRVLIPFLGSGNGLVSAHNLGMSAVGFELSKGYRDSFLVKIHDGAQYLR